MALYRLDFPALMQYTGDLNDLIRHGLHALRETLQQDKELTINNTSIGILGPAGPHEQSGESTVGDFRILEGEPIQVYLDTMLSKEEAMGIAPAAEPAPAPAEAPAGGEDVQMQE